MLVYNEAIGDLFKANKRFKFVHCVSKDYALGKGIALEFDKRFAMRSKLKSIHKIRGLGDCKLVDRTYNLITKELYYHKPTYDILEKSLISLREQCLLRGDKHLAMPLLGCGLDRLKWDKVKEILFKVFNDTDIEILVCRLE